MLEARTAMIDQIVTAALHPRVQGSLEFIGAMQHLGQWADVVAKAKRLIMSRQVQVKHNMPTHVEGHVIGDHGQYDCWISRHDPATSVIEQWNCQCPWSQYAFQRTRKWKKLEGRVCSHVLALYWRAKSTPLDDGSYDPDAPTAPFQRTRQFSDEEIDQLHPDEQGKYRPITETEADQGEGLDALPRTFGPEGETIGPDGQAVMDMGQMRQDRMDMTKGQPVPDTNQSLKKGPAMPFSLPRQQGPRTPEKSPYEHFQLFDVDTLAPPGYTPIAPQTKPSAPDLNPPMPGGSQVKLPGALSSVRPHRYDPPIIVLRTSRFVWAGSEFEQWVEDILRTGQQPTVQLRVPATLEQRGGKIPIPGAKPREINGEGIEKYHYLDLGWHPERQRRVNADEDPNGAPENRGVYSEAQAGRRGSVTDIEPMFKQVRVHIPLKESGRLMPHYLEGWVDYDDVLPVPDAASPFKPKF